MIYNCDRRINRFVFWKFWLSLLDYVTFEIGGYLRVEVFRVVIVVIRAQHSLVKISNWDIFILQMSANFSSKRFFDLLHELVLLQKYAVFLCLFKSFVFLSRKLNIVGFSGFQDWLVKHVDILWW
jgi:hypothetical protein